MRVSTNLLFELGQRAIGRAQANALDLEQRIASGKRLNLPSDDPIAAAAVMEARAAQAANDRYQSVRAEARKRLERVESALADAAELIAQVRTLATAAGNPALREADRASLATEIEESSRALLALANSVESPGRYLFSGYRVGIQPFAQTTGGKVTYAGDEGRLRLEVAGARELEVSFSGAQVFQRARDGNGAFVARPDSSNTGGGVIGAGTLTDAAAATGHRYRIVFSGNGPGLVYDVVDETLGTTIIAGRPYVPGATIAFDGVALEVSGHPAAGDRFAIEPAGYQDMFETLAQLAALLRAPRGDAAAAARDESARALAIARLDQAFDHLLGLRAETGARLAALETLDAEGEALAVHYARQVSRLEDLDYAAALSDLERTLLVLEAAQKAFLRLSALGLFARL